jgi:poly-gamma-glutamate capsule biosynthesis protein CapA/YwtB (metallophosphatase superfamily)
LAHFCVDHGADVVYGHGPHVVRGIEVYKNRFIAYSLGNFCTPYNVNLKGISGYAPIVEISINKDGSFLKGKIHSFLQTKGIGPRTDKKKSVALEMKRLSETDLPHSQAKIDSNGNIELKK